jgi:hypothetical protein
VDVYFSLGPDGDFQVSHLQEGRGPVLTWFSFVHHNNLIFQSSEVITYSMFVKELNDMNVEHLAHSQYAINITTYH